MSGGEGRRGGGVGKKGSSTSAATRRRLHLLPLSVKQNMKSLSALKQNASLQPEILTNYIIIFIQ